MTSWTEQESTACLQMLERGEPLTAVASEFKRSTDAILSKVKAIRETGKLTGQLVWTATETEHCLERWEQGASYSIIAFEIGKSRSAVAGRLKRLGKKRPAAAIVPTEKLPPYRGGWKRPGALPKPKGVTSMPVLKTSMHEIIRASDVQFDPSRSVATFEDRLTDGCTWPFGDEVPYTFCNQPCVKGLSYCPTHSRLAYTPTRANGGGW